MTVILGFSYFRRKKKHITLNVLNMLSMQGDYLCSFWSMCVLLLCVKIHSCVHVHMEARGIEASLRGHFSGDVLLCLVLVRLGLLLAWMK